MRSATLNVWALGGEWASRRVVLADGFRDLRPDVIALQEIIKTSTYDQAADILCADFQIVHQTRRAADGMGVTIASRWPIDDVRELDLHLTDRDAEFPCTTLVAEVRAPEPIGTLPFVNHFPNCQLDHEYERELQSVAAARFIDDAVGKRHMHVVVAGDLDAAPDAASIRFWTGRQSLGSMSVCYRDVWESVRPGETFTPQNPLHTPRDWPFRRIDYILVRCDRRNGPTLKILDAVRIFDSPVEGVWASDHFGVLADLDDCGMCCEKRPPAPPSGGGCGGLSGFERDLVSQVL